MRKCTVIWWSGAKAIAEFDQLMGETFEFEWLWWHRVCDFHILYESGDHVKLCDLCARRHSCASLAVQQKYLSQTCKKHSSFLW